LPLNRPPHLAAYYLLAHRQLNWSRRRRHSLRDIPEHQNLRSFF
jgi:hypothetical protein